ncbi:MAG: ATP synthase F1 subunit gamma [Crocinitomicaceae bacterium]|nr:ATP synthase F1 subunit gamma [Crocinitomicaceae bacterium]|tara:strand:- start:8389 stop:9264 length:876 start_codon:yes stop_codon:yes gene_type:complete
MANLKEIRTRISSVESTMQITSAMKMVSAAKLKRAQDAITQMRPFAKKFNDILLNVSGSVDGGEHPLMKKSSGKKVLLIAFSSNRGLCGGFNSNVIKEVKRIVQENPDKEYSILPIGKKVYDAFKKTSLINNNENLPKECEKIWDNLSYENAVEIILDIISSFQKEVFDESYIIYNSFKNAAIQKLTNEKFLPVEPIEESTDAKTVDYIFEPNQEEILNELIPNSLKIKFYKALLDSFASEHGARMTAMHKATDNATEMKKELTLFYNKARQASITSEILEIVAGAEALGG